jgi:hypothetical protein
VPALESTPVSCGSCGHVWESPLPALLTVNPGDSVTIAAGAIGATCPSCGATATNALSAMGMVQKDGLRLPPLPLLPVLRDLAQRDLSELAELRDEVAQLRANFDAAEARRLIERTEARSWLSQQSNRMEVWTILLVLAALVSILLALRPPQQNLTPDDIKHLIHGVVEQIHESGAQPHSVTPTRDR